MASLDGRSTLRALLFSGIVPLVISAIGLLSKEHKAAGLCLGTVVLLLLGFGFASMRHGSAARLVPQLFAGAGTGLLLFAMTGVLSGRIARGVVGLFALAVAEEFLFRIIAPTVFSRSLGVLEMRVRHLVGVLAAQALFASSHFVPGASVQHWAFPLFMKFVAAGIFFSFLVEVCGLGVAIGTHASINREVLSGLSSDAPLGADSIVLLMVCLVMVVARRVHNERGEADMLLQQWETPWLFEISSASRSALSRF